MKVRLQCTDKGDSHIVAVANSLSVMLNLLTSYFHLSLYHIGATKSIMFLILLQFIDRLYKLATVQKKKKKEFLKFCYMFSFCIFRFVCDSYYFSYVNKRFTFT